jgi:hypothetical protein
VDLPGQPAGQRGRRRDDPEGHRRVQGPEPKAHRPAGHGLFHRRGRRGRR